MLTTIDLSRVAIELRDEASRRSYVQRILAPEFVSDDEPWQLLLEMLEMVLHRNGLLIASESMLRKREF